VSAAWQRALGERIRAARRVAVLGVGSILRGDDAAGMLLIEYLQKKDLSSDNILLISGSTAPENFTGTICDFKPDLLLIADAAHIGASPGGMAILEEAQVTDGGFSTHMLPISLMLQYLRRHGISHTVLLGIQPKSTQFGALLCPEVVRSVRELAEFLDEKLNFLWQRS